MKSYISVYVIASDETCCMTIETDIPARMNSGDEISIDAFGENTIIINETVIWNMAFNRMEYSGELDFCGSEKLDFAIVVMESAGFREVPNSRTRVRNAKGS